MPKMFLDILRNVDSTYGPHDWALFSHDVYKVTGFKKYLCHPETIQKCLNVSSKGHFVG